MISFDGTECNKVGTSYTAFRGQSNKCNMPVSSCFQNQLNDLHNEDVSRQTNNKLPLYFLTRYGKFTSVIDTNIRYLEMQLQGSYPSMITLEFNADSLKFITAVSKGVIDSVAITNFEALTLNGLLVVQITNIGNIAAQFTLCVFCSTGVSPIASLPVSLDIMQSETTKFNIQVINQDSNEYNCNVTLLNSIGEVSDMKNVTFNTTDRQTNQGTEGGNGNVPNGSSSNNKSTAEVGCSNLCPT